ncbi:MAG: pyrimidine-nucleoside phosphorylase [Lachnospiraceae bacterium]
MRMYDLILKKRDGGSLSREEIEYLITGYVDGTIPDYQMAAFLMAVYYKGMTPEETLDMTMAVVHSGEQIDLSVIPGIKVDKHSTGGVGDKTTLVVEPIVASCGVKVAKMSGRGLGHTGGTIDKLESIPGMRTTLSSKEFIDIVMRNGLSVMGQSAKLTPADKMMYALRDVTATVDSIPLIAVSIMSKKIAAGSDAIVLDVKMGSGAFMKTYEDACALAEECVRIGENAGRETVALITNMDEPLGYAIGNSLEVIEAIDTLKRNGPKDFVEVCIELAANMLYLAKAAATMEEAGMMAEDALLSGKAYQSFKKMVQAQGGDISYIEDTSRFAKAQYQYAVKAPRDGYITHIDAQQYGIASCMLGAGRMTKEDRIDMKAGIVCKAKVGDFVKRGDVMSVCFASEPSLFASAEKMILDATKLHEEKIEKGDMIYKRISHVASAH